MRYAARAVAPARAAGRGSAPRAGPRRTSRWRRAGEWPARPGSRPGGRCGPRCRRGGGPGRTRRLTASSGGVWSRSHSATAITSTNAAIPSTSISSAPSRKLPTTSPIAAPSRDQPRRVRVTARVVEGPVGGPEVGHVASLSRRPRPAPAPTSGSSARRRRRETPRSWASGASRSRCSSTEGQHALHVVGDHVVAAEAGGERARRRAAATATPRGLAPSTRSGWRRDAATRSTM